MDKFTIVWSERAESQMLKLPHTISKVIYHKVFDLSNDPFKNVKKLRGSNYFRLRVGDYRVIFDMHKNELRILVVFVGHRKNIYKRF